MNDTGQEIDRDVDRDAAQQRPARTEGARTVAPAAAFALALVASCGGSSPGGANAGGQAGAAALSGEGSGTEGQVDCAPVQEPLLEIELPLLEGALPYPEAWVTDDAWPEDANPSGSESPGGDAITIPNGRPIYALIVSGYEANRHLDELLVYDFASYLMEQGAYVHFSWWNNLLAPYMGRPLHHGDSYPGDLANDVEKFGALEGEAAHGGAKRKAYPAEDFQFIADAKRMLEAIRAENPSAMILLVGHGMGGSAVAHLAAETDVLIDLVAPIDPVGNRNFPWAGRAEDLGEDYSNWTRWRATRDGFQGFQGTVLLTEQGDVPDELWTGPGCYPEDGFLPNVEEVGDCDMTGPVADAAGALAFGERVVNLFHRWQSEAAFPTDFDAEHLFDHAPPPGGTSDQGAVAGVLTGTLDAPVPDAGGWPWSVMDAGYLDQCCPTEEGVAWDADGHGEIVGSRGPVDTDLAALIHTSSAIPLGTRVRTSPECLNCPDPEWPSRTSTASGDQMLEWDDTPVNQEARVALLKELEESSFASPGFGETWAHRPTNPDLCLVSDDLIALFDSMNRPPQADAGMDQTVECTGPEGTDVMLDASSTTDPDEGDALTYEWTWPLGSASGEIALVQLPHGTHCIELTVRDPSGHVDVDQVEVTIQDTTPPEMTLALSETLLWPPNHKLVPVDADVTAEDVCGEVAELVLVSITSSDPDNGKGDGNTTDDIQGVEPGTFDTSFLLRAEVSGLSGERVYTVTYAATDESGNTSEMSGEVWVKNPGKGKP